METPPYTHSGNTTNLLVFLRAEVESLDKPSITVTVEQCAVVKTKYQLQIHHLNQLIDKNIFTLKLKIAFCCSLQYKPF